MKNNKKNSKKIKYWKIKMILLYIMKNGKNLLKIIKEMFKNKN